MVVRPKKLPVALKEPPFAGAAVSNGGCLHKFPGRAGVDVLSALWRVNLILVGNFTGTALQAEGCEFDFRWCHCSS